MNQAKFYTLDFERDDDEEDLIYLKLVKFAARK